VRLSWPGGSTGPLAVGRDGAVTLPSAVHAKRFRLDVLAASPGTQEAVAVGELRAPGLPRSRPLPPDARLPAGSGRAACGPLGATVGSRRLILDPRATVGELDSGRPVRVRSCGPPVALPDRQVVLHTEPGVLRPYVLALRSPAPSPAPPPAPAGTVIDPGHEGRGEYTGVKVAPRGPARLVLGESYSRGWRAECDGRSLGEPEVVDGFANGWRVDGRCRNVSFRFAPQTAVTAGHWFGAAVCALLLVILLLGAFRRRAQGFTPYRGNNPALDASGRASAGLPGGAGPPWPPVAVDDRPAAWPLRAAALAGLGAGVLLGFVFAIRAGVVIAPAVALILWRGVSPRALILAAGALLVVAVPVLYMAIPGDDRGGYDTEYAVEHIAAHWVTVAAVVLLVVALARTLSTASRPSRGRAPAPAGERAGRAPA
jgi:hypothetical protein